jgi:DNA-binding response OmpR family regulator
MATTLCQNRYRISLSLMRSDSNTPGIPDLPIPVCVALVDDDDLLRDRILSPRLRECGFKVLAFGSAAELFAGLAQGSIDMLVLDVGLPDQNGFEVARRLRAEAPHIGIVMLTGRGDSPDRIRGLGEGADVYLSKPVEIALLLASVQSLARRLHVQAGRRGRWRMDEGGWCLYSPSGKRIMLTQSERRLMARLETAPNTIVSREELIEGLTEGSVHDFDPHRLDSLIHRLRRKVQDVTDDALPLMAVHGEGYLFTPD